MRIEGNGYSKMVQVIAGISKSSYDGVSLELATVTAPLPDIKVKIDGMTIELEKGDLVIAERLVSHHRNMKLTTKDLTVNMTQAGTGPHTHDINEMAVNNSTAEYADVLKPGDRVIIAGMAGGQTYVILDKAVIP